jgi:tRNA-specific 2-thiouridylase
MTESPRIAVAMSGGVDSSVAAALLHEAGVQVFGLMLRLQDDADGQANRCVTVGRGHGAVVAASLDIPFYVVDAREVFEKHVISPFLLAMRKVTPNPVSSATARTLGTPRTHSPWARRTRHRPLCANLRRPSAQLARRRR